MVTFQEVNNSKVKKLKKYGFKAVPTKADYELERYSGACSVTLYKSGKLLLQGNDEDVKATEKIIKFIGIDSKEKVRFTGKAVGSDETLKGDTFGGIVVCGFYADDKIRKQLINMGIKDSKDLNNADITRLAKELIEKFPDNYHVEELLPVAYNKLTKTQNITKILDKLHKKVFSKCRKGRKDVIHIVDKYPGCSVGDIMETKAESKYFEVAAASIIGRYHGVKQIMTLGHEAGMFIPLGSSNVESALIQLQKKKLKPEQYVKLHFKNVKAAFR